MRTLVHEIQRREKKAARSKARARRVTSQLERPTQSSAPAPATAVSNVDFSLSSVSITPPTVQQHRPPAPIVLEDEYEPVPEGEEPPPAPLSVPSHLSQSVDESIAHVVAMANDPAVTALSVDILKLMAASRALGKALSQNEEKGDKRDELVSGIGEARAKIAALRNSKLSSETISMAQEVFYRALIAIAPYYSQMRNVNILEGDETRTCSLTALAMCIESLGGSAKDYAPEKRDAVIAIARYFQKNLSHAELALNGTQAEWRSLVGLRLSDFLELAAIAECLNDNHPTDAQIQKAAASDDKKEAKKTAWERIKDLGFLCALARRFGIEAKSNSLDVGPIKEHHRKKGDPEIPWSQFYPWEALREFGSIYRSATEEVVDARNNAEKTADWTAYNKLAKQNANAFTNIKIDSKLSVRAFKQAVLEQIAPLLWSGAAIEVLMTRHYIRLEAIHDDYVIVDDPGRTGRVNRKVTWPEARAMGFFKDYIVFRK